MAPAVPSLGSANPLALVEFIAASKRHAFLQPPASIPSASLNLVKDTLESFAGHVGEEQLRLLREENRKRKRSERLKPDEAEVLKVRKVHVDGFETNQVWQQAKRIISSALKALKMPYANSRRGSSGEEYGSDGSDIEARLEDLESDDELGEDVDFGDEDGMGLDGEEDGEDGEEDGEGLEGDEVEDDEDEDAEEFVEDVHGLNDGFFSIDDFNRQTQWFENQDARGDPNTDVASDDEDINWDADPYSTEAIIAKKGKKADKTKKDDDRFNLGMDEDDEEEADDDDDEEGGPTFGNMDLYAPEGDSDNEMGGDFGQEGEEEDDGGDNANDIFYKDFFAPPPRKYKEGKPRRKNVRFEKPADADIDRAISNVRRDLFEDLSDREDSDDALSEASAGDLKSRKSVHERRQAKIAEEIRKLEAANVAKREWTLSEDLDFEHVGKPVLVITPEVTEGIEDLIKRRILANEFDDILRRRPDSDPTANGRRGLVDVEDTKSKKGLAEIYEEEHVKNANPDTYVSQADEKLRKEEQEVEQMWRDVSAKLDALSSWHYKPKPSAPTITVVADVATVAMEDAQPATAQGVAGGESMIAPQEVYRAGASKETVEQGEVVPKSGLPVARQEMTREEKLRRRRRDKERKRKAGATGLAAANGANRQPGAKRSKTDTLADLRKGGVKVINKKGEILDVDGNRPKAAQLVTSGGYKL
ncbi:unnamed protein product [Parascedosporium putredinis]|uniref:U3 small nucleolar ribonucleoprotein protein MPP10 n=1 Tax=Parascedosporium putredinis TaxID=1442378 RepID=A0A9P1M6M9_9PEZI|nr:unnamed protein product [Parascedosporium putredinis]CAI7990027.1 unnamed protein product [Parascedosporium putredinis]